MPLQQGTFLSLFSQNVAVGMEFEWTIFCSRERVDCLQTYRQYRLNVDRAPPGVLPAKRHLARAGPISLKRKRRRTALHCSAYTAEQSGAIDKSRGE